ncbi:TonB-dependent receptor plug domain-containing protein [Chitinophaga oryzae]|uniref:TonB-dependent receptor plug domain-containing protein n=1 Tax=Chitinophaga oryzae TaxID=2725414 RepID=A0AAE6ZMS1_9BACT|nr:STN domain-containing protein [Chitinophaga oryzae]QJB35876.1 TonB-dependent receptor plug domain-containing protein [Chitinophaga oryzae]
MKLTLVLMIAALMEVSATSYAQKVTLSAKKIALSDVFRQIRKQTAYNVLWNVDILKDAQPVAIQATNASVEDVLKQCFAQQPFTYSIHQNTIVITRKSGATVVAITIKGSVTDVTNRPLPGVAVRLKGTQTGTATLADGTFTLTVPDAGGVLLFNYMGYTPKEVPINGQTVIHVQLEQASSQLNEVVVAYGKQNTREIVGSVAKLSAVDIKDQPTGTFAERLQGKLPGVQVPQTTGRPGQGMDLRVRGAASLTSNVRPLVVVDGQPMLGNPDNINNINPDEIESFTVLKDASSTALYGSRAANGVIMITTKRGKAGATRIDFNSYYGSASLMRELIPR